MSSSSTQECPICYSDAYLRTADCGHAICRPCWRQIRLGNRRCPFCRARTDTPTSSDEYQEMPFGEQFVHFLQTAPEGQRPFTSHYDWFLKISRKILGRNCPLRFEILATFAIQPALADPQPCPDIHHYLQSILGPGSYEELLRNYMALLSRPT